MGGAGSTRSWRGVVGAVLRVTIALVVAVVVLSDCAGRRARAALDALADVDFAAKVRELREQQRYGEAIVYAEEGKRWVRGEALVRLAREEELTRAEEASWVRKVRDGGAGIVRGAWTGEGTTLAELAGAISADMLIVGDVRDLFVQSARGWRGEEVDELVVLLSAAGVVTTLAPEIDWAPALLKAARKSGAMTRRFGESLALVLRARHVKSLVAICEDVAGVAKRVGAGGAMRVLKGCDSPGELRRVAAFVRGAEGGGFAVVHTGEAGVRWLTRDAKSLGLAEREAETLLLRVARKGPAGVDVVKKYGKVLVRPHWLVGGLKAIAKGRAGEVLGVIADGIAAALRAMSAGVAAVVVVVMGVWIAWEVWRLQGRTWETRR